jgi:hypothetical protein
VMFLFAQAALHQPWGCRLHVPPESWCPPTIQCHNPEDHNLYIYVHTQMFKDTGFIYLVVTELPVVLSQWQQSCWLGEVQHGTHWLFNRSKCRGNTHARQLNGPGPLHERQLLWHDLQSCVGGS